DANAAVRELRRQHRATAAALRSTRAHPGVALRRQSRLPTDGSHHHEAVHAKHRLGRPDRLPALATDHRLSANKATMIAAITTRPTAARATQRPGCALPRDVAAKRSPTCFIDGRSFGSFARHSSASVASDSGYGGCTTGAGGGTSACW